MTSIEDANSKPQSAAVIRNAEDVLNEIKRWIQSDENQNSAKFYGNAVDHMTWKVERDLFCLETTLVERQYVKTVLEMWLRQSLKKAFEYLTDENTDISMEMITILNELNLINSFEDIRSNLDGATSRLKEWCDGDSSHFKCRYFQLILDQRDLFSTMPRFTILVSSYLKQFKTSCTEKIFSRCLGDIAEDETSGEKTLHFISFLMELFENANEDIRIQNILEENITEFCVTDDKSRTGRDFINKILEIMENCSTAKGRQLPEWLILMKSETEWTQKLELLSKEIYKKFLAVKTEIKIIDEYGRKIIFVYGVAIFISKIVKEMLQLKGKHPDIQEIQIIGLASIHVDKDLESKDWHGINVGIVTNKLYVDADQVWWDVSGKNGNDKVAEGHGTDQAGESGGNVHVICNEMINAERWTIICDGGDGSDRVNGDGEIGPDGKSQKWSKEKFEKAFPSMSTFDTGEEALRLVPYSDNAIKTVLTNLEKILPKENRSIGSDIQPEHSDTFFITGETKDGSTITASFYRSKTKRNTLILCQGSKVGPGEGGFGGTITFELIGDQGTLVKEAQVPFIGTGKSEVTTVRMGVYEATASDGSSGEEVGDVGFMHNLDTSSKSAMDNLAGNYIGFGNEVRLKMERSKEKPTRKPVDPKDNFYAKLNKAEYASIVPCENRDFDQDNSLWLAVAKAVKKKAIIRENLAQYLSHVDERKQVTQSFQMTLSSTMEHKSSNTKELINKLINQMEKKEAQLHQLLSQCNQGMEKIGSVKFVKPALKKKTDTSHFLTAGRIIGRRPVDFRSEPPVYFRCFDVLPTPGGFNNVLHCIFGRMISNGLYLCNNTNTLRNRLAKFILNKSNKTKIKLSLAQFMSRMKKCYRLNFPVACRIKDRLDEKEKFNWEEEITSDELFDEYAKFVQSPSSELDFVELKMLAEIHFLTIHVYEEQSTLSFKFKETLNPNQHNTKFILQDGSGEWQRLEPNLKLEKFCETLDSDLFECQSFQTNSFKMLMNWLKTHETNEKVITSLMNFNPEDGDTPDKLSLLLLEHLERRYEQEGDEEMTDDKKETIAHDLCHLVECVLEYNNRNISPIFYLSIVKECKDPQEWKFYLIMFQLEDRWATVPRDRDLKKDLFESLWEIDNEMMLAVTLLHKKIAATGSCSILDIKPFIKLMKMIEESFEKNMINEYQMSEIQELPLCDWIYELRSKKWQTVINQLSADLSAKENKKLKKEAVHFLMELEFKEGDGFCEELMEEMEDLELLVTKLQDNLYPGKNDNKENSVERKLDEIISMMARDLSEKEEWSYNKYTTMLTNVKNNVERSKITSLEIKESQMNKLIKEWQTNGLELNDQSIVEFLCVYDYAVQKIFTKKEDQQIFRLRDTQRVAITTLLTSNRKATLTQVSTGEGKSLIVTGVAIAFALSRNKKNNKISQKVDVITSNDMLAIRDSNLTVSDGGMRNLYEYFNISVANNCNQSVHNRTKAYNSAVVYGQLANFQRDHLLDKFYNLNILSDRTMDHVIIDEVDCMLLDRGNNTLYLSHDIPGMETLESVYVFIWEKICDSTTTETDKSILKESVKNAVFYDLYGAITKEDLESIHEPLKNQPSEKNALWDYLIDEQVIDAEGRMFMESAIQNISYRENLNPKIAFYFRNVAERERCIKIPHHLIPFVERHLNSWLDSALHALELKRDEDYVVDQDRTDTSPDLNPQVIIIDPDTGTDQISSQWDEALHQFIQLKEGCKLTLQSLKSIFISNARYMKDYEKLTGVSGTLGSTTDRNSMKRNYKCDYFVIPTAFIKRFYLKPPKVFKSRDSWLNGIIKETKKTILITRSIVIFCHSIKSVNLVHQRLKNSNIMNMDYVHCYTRDYEKFAFESQSLEAGHVIIATNLAGRGTDIKISQQLRDNGGLHICLTFLPKNERIEEQAMGRSARNGAPGSGIFILCDESTQTSTGGLKLGAGKFFSMKEERQWQEKQRISCFDKDAINMEHEATFFGEFSSHYIEMQCKLKERGYEDQEIKIICDSVLDKWALWLDETVDQLELSYSYYMEEFKNFISDLSFPDNNTPNIRWMMPVRSVAMAKHLGKRKENPDLSTAAEILERIIISNDSFCYPSAYYYHAFVLLRGDLKKDKTKFIRHLHTCESILNQNVEMELSFYRKVTQTLKNRDQTSSFCAVDAYKQQKDNMVQLLEYLIGTIRSLLGNNSCSVSDLEKAGIDPPKIQGFFEKLAKDIKLFYDKNTNDFQPFRKTGKIEESKNHKISPKKANELFQSLVKSTKCIVCQVNNSDTIPYQRATTEKDGVSTKSRFEIAIEQVAYDYDVGASILKNALDSVFGKGLAEKDTEKEIEKKLKSKIEAELKNKNLVPFTRESFWKKLVDDEALHVIEGGKCSNMECIIVSKKECEIETKLDVENSITLNFGFDTNYNLDKNRNIYVLFNPTYANRTELERKNKLIFSKQYVKHTLPNDEYRRRKTNFERNKIAKLDAKNLKNLKLKSFGQLGRDDLKRANITNASEQDGVWKALMEQNIIDEFGYLSSKYSDEDFSYSDCPAYEDNVMRLLGRKFAAEIVRRQWLTAAEKHLKCEELKSFKAKQETDEKNIRLKTINVLPLKPYRDMLSDLMARHVISGLRVTENPSVNFEEEIKQINDSDEEERKCMVKFLKSRQPIYANRMKEYDVVLHFIERDIRNIEKLNNISSELYTFDLLGLNQVIGIVDRERSWKTVCVTSTISTLIIAGGVASVGAGTFLVYNKLLAFGFCKHLLFGGGLSDIMYAITTILTRGNFTWADYTRQRLRSVMGKSEPIDTIKTIWELFKSSEKISHDTNIRLIIELERRRRQSRYKIMAQSETLLLDKAKTQLGMEDHKNEFYFHNRLHSQSLLLRIYLIEKINTLITKNSIEINTTLSQFYRLNGQGEAQLLTGVKIIAFTTSWFENGCKWVSEVESTINSKLTEIGINGKMEKIHSIEKILQDMKPQMVCQTLKQVQAFILDLGNDPLLPSATFIANEFIDDEEIKRFKKRAITDLKAELARKAQVVVEFMTRGLHQITSDHINTTSEH